MAECKELSELRARVDAMAERPEPKAAPPTCAKCGGHPLVKVLPNGLCFECDAEAARVEKLRARIANWKGDCAVQWRSGGVAIVVYPLECDGVNICVWDNCGHRTWMPLSGIAAILVPEEAPDEA